nr:unnamed protein product [Callosobruchus analis]
MGGRMLALHKARLAKEIATRIDKNINSELVMKIAALGFWLYGAAQDLYRPQLVLALPPGYAVIGAKNGETGTLSGRQDTVSDLDWKDSSEACSSSHIHPEIQESQAHALSDVHPEIQEPQVNDSDISADCNIISSDRFW